MEGKQLISFIEQKEIHPDCIILYRKGDFYAAYGNDASRISDICGITLRKSYIHSIVVPVVEFSHYNIDTILPRIIRAGERVYITDLNKQDHVSI